MIGIYRREIDMLLALATSGDFLRIKPTDAQRIPIWEISGVLLMGGGGQVIIRQHDHGP